MVERRTGVQVGDVEGDAALGHRLAAEVEGGDGEVVDVDLGADAADAAAVELDQLAGPAESAALGLGLTFAEQPALDEFGDEAADGGLVEAGVRGDPGARARSVLPDVPQDDGEVVAAERHMVGRDDPAARTTATGQRHQPHPLLPRQENGIPARRLKRPLGMVVMPVTDFVC